MRKIRARKYFQLTRSTSGKSEKESIEIWRYEAKRSPSRTKRLEGNNNSVMMSDTIYRRRENSHTHHYTKNFFAYQCRIVNQLNKGSRRRMRWSTNNLEFMPSWEARGGFRMLIRVCLLFATSEIFVIKLKCACLDMYVSKSNKKVYLDFTISLVSLLPQLPIPSFLCIFIPNYSWCFRRKFILIACFRQKYHNSSSTNYFTRAACAE